MNVSFSDIKLVAMAGYASVWRIPPEDCIETPTGVFVRMKPFGNSAARTTAAHKHTLLSMVVEANDNIPMGDDAKSKISSLTLNAGYDYIVKQRNDASVFIDTAPPPSALFSNASDGKPPNPAHRAQKRMKKYKMEPDKDETILDEVEISIKVNDSIVVIDVLKACNANAALFIKYDVDMIGNVIKYMRDNAFADPEHKQKLPDGIQQPKRLKGRFLAKAKSLDGKVMWYTTDNISSAADWQARAASGEVCDEAGEHIDVAGNEDECPES